MGLSFLTKDHCQRFIYLRKYLTSEEAAGRVHENRATLTRGCHHRSYELAPVAEEIVTAMQPVGSMSSSAAAATGAERRA